MVRVFRILLVVAVAMIAAMGLGPGVARADDPPSGEPQPAAHYTDDSQDFSRSLIYSGAVALSVATIGLAMVGWRRRQW